jgi:hypothetical protein
MTLSIRIRKGESVILFDPGTGRKIGAITYAPNSVGKRIKLAVDADLNDLAVYRKELVGNAKTLEEVHERRKANNAHVTETE